MVNDIDRPPLRPHVVDDKRVMFIQRKIHVYHNILNNQKSLKWLPAYVETILL